MSVPQAKMCWKISAKEIQPFPRMRVGEKHSVSLMKKKNKKEKERKKNQRHFRCKDHLLSCTALKLAGRNSFIRNYTFFTFPVKINLVWAPYKPLKNCGLCEFTTTWDWKELPNGLNSVPCSHDKCTVDVQFQELCNLGMSSCKPLAPKHSIIMLYYNTLKTQSLRLKPLCQFGTGRK